MGKPWMREEVPFYNTLEDTDRRNPRLAAAAREAMLELFGRYPEKYEDGINRGWRRTALKHLDKGTIGSAIYFADGTGVPQEDLAALAALLACAAGAPSGTE